MIRANLENRRYSEQLLFICLIVIASWLFFQIISLLTGIWIFKIPFNEVQYAMQKLDEPEFVNFLKYLQSLTSIGLFAIPSLLIAYLFSGNMFSYMELNRTPAISVILLACLIMIFSLPMNNFLTYLNLKLELPEVLSGLQDYFVRKEEQGAEIMTSFLNNPGIWSLLLNIVIVAVIPAFAEEFFFRGILQKLFIGWTRNVHIGIILTGIIFALVHFQFLSALPRIVQGIILGYLFYWTRSLWIPIIAHFINNAIAVLFYHFYYEGRLGNEMEEIGTPGSGYYYAGISLILVLFLLIAIKRRMKDNQPIPA